MIMDQPKI